MSTNTKPRICGDCDKTDGMIYTTCPAKVKCTISGKYRGLGDECDQVSQSAFCERIGVVPGQPFIVHGYPNRRYPPMVYCSDGMVRLYSPDGKRRNKVGSGALIYAFDHPESVEPCEGYTPAEVAFKKEVKKVSEQKTPVKDWTLGEAKEYCEGRRKSIRDGYECENNCPLSQCGLCCCEPRDMRFTPRFTEDEVDMLKALYSVGARYLARGKHLRWYHNKPYQRVEDDKWGMRGDWGTGSGKLPKRMFSGLLPGQSVTISEVIGQ